jgi:hypothetical protein
MSHECHTNVALHVLTTIDAELITAKRSLTCVDGHCYFRLLGLRVAGTQLRAFCGRGF